MNEKQISDSEKIFSCFCFLFYPAAVYFFIKNKNNDNEDFLTNNSMQAFFFWTIFIVITFVSAIIYKILILINAELFAGLALIYFFFFLFMSVMVILYSFWAARGIRFKIPFVANIINLTMKKQV